MLCCLTCKCELEFLNFVVAKQIVQGASKATLKGSRGGHTCAKRHITGKGGIETFYRNSEFHHLTADSENEAEMSCCWTFFIVEREFSIIFQVDRISADFACSIGFNFSNYTLFYGTGEYETTVIVGVFTNDIDTAGRSIYRTRSAIEVLQETTSYIFNC